MLWLFNSDGSGFYANDDIDDENRKSTLPTTGSPSAAGVYYIAVSSFEAEPRDAGGQDIFPTPSNSTDIVTAADNDPVTGWRNNGEESGTYRITLTGAVICAPTAVCAAPPPPGPNDTVLTPNQQFTAPNNAPRVIFGSTGNERIQAGDGRDIIFAGPGQDFVDGGDASDIICGQDGHDLLRGGGGADFIDGGPGNDRLEGGNGNDALFGGDGHDTLDGQGGVANGGNGGLGNDLCLNLAVSTNCP